MDVSRAFDTISHAILMASLHNFAQLAIPDNIYSRFSFGPCHWVVSFLQDRKHVIRFWGQLSTIKTINASAVQGSGMYVIRASDLHPISLEDSVGKYVDNIP